MLLANYIVVFHFGKRTLILETGGLWGEAPSWRDLVINKFNRFTIRIIHSKTFLNDKTNTKVLRTLYLTFYTSNTVFLRNSNHKWLFLQGRF